MRITQQMVADAAGVSIATVSRALAGHDGIPLETRRRVEQIARRLGYQSNERNNKRQKQVETIGVLAAANAGIVLPELLAGISAEAGAAGIGTAVHVLASESAAEAAEQICQWPMLASGNLAGVIAVGWWPDGLLTEILGSLPFVVVGTGDGPERITPDPIAETTATHQFLRELGHRNVAFCSAASGELEEALCEAAFANADRSAGSSDPVVATIDDHTRIRQLTMSRITAWICPDARTARRLEATLDELKLKVPTDLSIATLTNNGRPPRGGTAVVRYNWRDIGALALSRLQSRTANGGGLPPAVTTVTGVPTADPAAFAPPPGAR